MFKDLYKKIANILLPKKDKVEIPTQISENFTIDEFKVSADYPEVAKNIIITDDIRDNLVILILTVLQPIRTTLNESMNILSGLRDNALNKLIGGVNGSDHQYGMACDFTCSSIINNIKDVAYKIWDLDLPIRQLIYYPEQNFIHISINSSIKPYKHELLRKENGIYIKEV